MVSLVKIISLISEAIKSWNETRSPFQGELDIYFILFYFNRKERYR